MAQSFEQIELFNGLVQNFSCQLGLNSTPTSLSLNVVSDDDDNKINIATRQIERVEIGEFTFNGIVQSWDRSVQDLKGNGIYTIKMTDFKPVLNACQVIINSAFQQITRVSFNNPNELDRTTTPRNYGNNVVPVEADKTTELNEGIPWTKIAQRIQNESFRYGGKTFTVDLDFILPKRGASEYVIKSGVFTISELISKVADDHGLDWVVDTDVVGNVVKVIMITRNSRNNTNLSLVQLKNLHNGAIVREKEGREHRDPNLRVVVVGGYRNFLGRVTDNTKIFQYWGTTDNGVERTEPKFDRRVMEKVLNNAFDPDEFTEAKVQEILNYANEFWGRKFKFTFTGNDLDEDGNVWYLPSSAGWWETIGRPGNINSDGTFKFQTDDGRWIPCARLPQPGLRTVTGPGLITIGQASQTGVIPDGTDGSEVVNFSWSDKVYGDPNVHSQNENRDIFMKISVEAQDDYFLISLATPLRVKKTAVLDQQQQAIQTRAEFLEDLFLAVIDQRLQYGPWYDNKYKTGKLFIASPPKALAQGKTKVVVNTSLVPWGFGFRGITNAQGIDQLEQVVGAEIKTIDDNTIDADTFELEVAGLPKVNIARQINKTGMVTNMSVSYGIGGVRTTYRSRQFTDEFSRFKKDKDDLIAELKRQSDQKNNSLNPPLDGFAIQKEVRSALRKEVFDSQVGDTLRDIKDNNLLQETFLGVVEERSSVTEPKYNIQPKAWQQDSFGSLTLVNDPDRAGRFLDVINFAENASGPGRLAIGTQVEVKPFSINNFGVVSYFISKNVEKPSQSAGTIVGLATADTDTPTYMVDLLATTRTDNLLASEIASLVAVENIGEPPNYAGGLAVGTQVTVIWQENTNGIFVPIIEQQLNRFRSDPGA